MRKFSILATLAFTLGCSAGAVSPYQGTASDSTASESAGSTGGSSAGGSGTLSGITMGGATDSNTPTTITPPPAPVLQNCNTALYPVCDGFELATLGGPPDGNRWDHNVTLPPPDDTAVHTDNPNEDHIVISNKFAHSGKQSLLFHTVGGAEHIPIEAVTSAEFPKSFFPAPNNTFFVRYWVYHDATTFQPTGGHWYMVNASGPLDGRQQYEKMGGGGTNFGWNYFGPDAGVGSATVWPLGKWSCIETEFKGDTQELFVWLNNTELSDMHVPAGQWAAPAYNRLTLGWEIDHPDASYPGADVYVDDVVFAYSRIGCN